MENWGLVTYSTFGLTSPDDYLIAHEVAHQWFGNLVTPARWSEIWLSEGPSNYYKYHGLDDINVGPLCTIRACHSMSKPNIL